MIDAGDVALSLTRSIVGVDDDDLGARLLAGVPTNESRSAAELLRCSVRATAYGRALADDHGRDGTGETERLDVVEASGGLREGVLARYDSRHHRVELFVDAIAYCEALVDRLGWRDAFPTGSVRAAALEHERAHHLVTEDRSRGLRTAIGLEVFRFGRIRRFAYVAGADEVAAHAFAGRTLGLGRSPLLLTAAATAALAARDDAPGAHTAKEN